MKKQLQYFGGIVLLLLATAFFNNASAQVIHTQSFDTTQFLPPGWTPAGSVNNWSRQTNGTQPTCTPHSVPGMARFWRNANPGTIQTFSSPVIDYSSRGVDTPRVSFWIFRDAGAPTVADIITIYVNTAPNLTGATSLGTVARSRLINLPDTQVVNGWYQYTFDIPASFNTGTNYLLFRGANDANQGNNIFIDDIQYNSFPTPCTGSPTPGNIVAADSVICNGGGSSLLSLNGQSTDTGIVIQWKSGTSVTGPWNDFGASVTSVSTGNITATTYYYAVLTCNSSALSDSTPVIYVAVDSNPPPVVIVTASNNGNYCSGVPVILIASGASEYTWTPATGLDTIAGDTVLASPPGAPGDATEYFVTGTNVSGCRGTDSTVVTVHSTTIVNIQATPNDTVCSGQTLTLNAVPGGGPMVTDYLWSPGGDSTQSISLVPGADSTYIVQVTNNWGCTDTASIQITVVTGVVPVITSLTANPANALYCIGGTPVSLVVTGTGATTVTWSPAAGLNTTSGDSVLSSPPMGFGGNILYTVTLTNASGCADSDTIRVRRGNRPPLNLNVSSDSICAGDSVTLNANSPGGSPTFLWTPGGATTQVITVAPPNNIVYNIQVTAANGCTRDSTVQITVSPGPSAAFGYTMTSGTRTVTFHDSSTNAAGYEWLFGDSTLSFAQNPVHTYSADGTYTIKLIVTNGACTADTAVVTITVTAIGIEEINSVDVISLSPNPTENFSIIEFRADHNVSLQVINSLGEVVSERKINSGGNRVHKETIDMSKFPSGVYMIHIHSTQKNISRKLIKL